MNDVVLFTDASVNPKLNIGYGAWLIVPREGLLLDNLKTRVKVKRFENTSSTKLELQTLLWAIDEIKKVKKDCKITVYTDSQNITGLRRRRDRLEKNNYLSRKNKPIKNYKLYCKFYGMIDELDIKFIKVKGHKISTQKDEIDKLFTLVDRASRNALRCSVVGKKKSPGVLSSD